MSVYVNVNVRVDEPGKPGCFPFDQVSIGPFGSLPRPEPKTMDLILGNNQFANVHLHGLKESQAEGKFVKPPTWQLDAAAAAVAIATPSADGLTCEVKGMGVNGPLGSGTLTVTDNDDPTVIPLVFNLTIRDEPVRTLAATIDAPTELPVGAPATGAPTGTPAPATP